jgi:hypothetical protein
MRGIGDERARRTIQPDAAAGLAPAATERTTGEEVTGMCMSCGCGVADAAHGDERHITLDDLEAAANAVGITLDEVIRNIVETLPRPAKAPSDSTTTR